MNALIRVPVIDTGAGAAVLGNPLRCVAWLANTLGTFGEGLRAGDVVLAGALHRAVPVAGGEAYRAQAREIGLTAARSRNPPRRSENLSGPAGIVSLGVPR